MDIEFCQMSLFIEMIIFFFQFVNMVNHIDLRMSNQICIPGINHSWDLYTFELKLLEFHLEFFLLISRERGREGENLNVWFSLTCPLLGTWPTTQACAPTGNQTRDPLVRRLALNPHLPRLEFFIYVHERYGSVGVFSPLLLVSENAVLVEWLRMLLSLQCI